MFNKEELQSLIGKLEVTGDTMIQEDRDKITMLLKQLLLIIEQKDECMQQAKNITEVSCGSGWNMMAVQVLSNIADEQTTLYDDNDRIQLEKYLDPAYRLQLEIKELEKYMEIPK